MYRVYGQLRFTYKPLWRRYKDFLYIFQSGSAVFSPLTAVLRCFSAVDGFCLNLSCLSYASAGKAHAVLPDLSKHIIKLFAL